RCGRGESERFRIIRENAHQEPAALVELQLAQRSQSFPAVEWHSELNLSVFDDLNTRNGVARRQRGGDLQVQSFAFGGLEDVPGKFTVDLTPEQGTVGDKTPTGPESFPPFFIGQRPVEMNIDSVVAHWVGQHAGGAACGGRNPQAAIEGVVVNLLSP